MKKNLGRNPEEAAREGLDYLKLSNRAYLIILACAAPMFILFAWLGQDVRGFVASLSVAAILGVAAIMRPHSRQPMYWATLLAMTVSHGLIVMLIPWPPSFQGPGIVFAPIVIVDMYAWARFLLAMVRARRA
jgi:hypothetical protein